MDANPQEQFRAMGEGLTTPKKGSKRTWSEHTPSKALAITKDDLANANSFGDGKTKYCDGATFHQ